MSFPIPHEIAIGGVYLPPLLVAAVFGTLAAAITASLFNRFRLTRYLSNPPAVFVALSIIYTLAIGTLVTGA